VWLLIVTGLLFSGCTAALVGAASLTDTSSPPAAEAPAEEAPTDKAPGEQAPAEPDTKAGLNQPVRDGKFEFTVTKVACGRKTVGSNEFTRATATGKFCVAGVKVENIGNEAQDFHASSQFLYDQQDRQHSVDNDAWLALETNAFLEEINPGNKVTGTLVFDVPKDTKPTKLELHDSPFSGGVEVQL
jgi:hypothetical protein